MINKQKFWQARGKLMSLTSIPHALTDGFMMDLSDDGVERAQLQILQRVSNAKTEKRGETLLGYAEAACIPLRQVAIGRDGEVEYSARKTLKSFIVSVWQTPEGRQILIQHKYSEYFIRLYPGCEFFILAKKKNSPVIIKRNGQMVGMVMPLSYLTKFYAIKPISKEGNDG